MIRIFVLVVMLLALVRPGVARSQGGGGIIAKLAQAAADGTLTVNGEDLDRREVERQTVYLVAPRLVHQKLVELILDDHVEARVKAGERREALSVSEDEVRKRIVGTIKGFTENNPGKDFWAEQARTGTDRPAYEMQQRTMLRLDKAFFRGLPSEWPEITKEAIRAAGGDQGRLFFDRLSAQAGERQEVPSLWLHICRQWVLSKLQAGCDVRYASDGLPPEVCLSVNGRQWRTEEAVRSLQVQPEDRLRAQVDIVVRAALRQELTKAGAWLSEADFRREFAARREPYANTCINPKVPPLTAMGYPSLEVYKSHWRLARSFERMIAKEIDDEAVEKHLEQVKDGLAGGLVSVQILRIPAVDDATGTWKEGGFEQASRIAASVMADVQQARTEWQAAMASGSKWPEQLQHQGHLDNSSLGELRSALRESEYTDLVDGCSVAEVLFFDTKVGSVVGPLRGSDAFYLAKVVDRRPAIGSLSLADRDQRDLVERDYVRRRFLAWARGIAARTEVR